MDVLNNLKISHKLWIGFALLLTLMLISNAVGYRGLGAVNHDLETVAL